MKTPLIGQSYYAILITNGHVMAVPEVWQNHWHDQCRLNQGNVFETEALAKVKIKQILYILRDESRNFLE